VLVSAIMIAQARRNSWSELLTLGAAAESQIGSTVTLRTGSSGIS